MATHSPAMSRDVKEAVKTEYARLISGPGAPPFASAGGRWRSSRHGARIDPLPPARAAILALERAKLQVEKQKGAWVRGLCVQCGT